MLSIGKLVSGAERYYLGVVASGREEYYTGSGESPGVWVGEGSERLGLDGEVDPEHLRLVLDGIFPGDGNSLVTRRPAAGRVAGFDLTFSAPKSVSLLYGLGPDWVGDSVRSAHDTATKDALTYLERHALYARRGAGGETRVATTGAVATAFRHRTSRAGDPQLHTHVLLANVVEGADGKWSAPDARLVYFHGRTAGFVYQAVLRAELGRSLGVRFEVPAKGLAEIEGMDKAMLRAFATRRSEIEGRLEEWGTSSARAAEMAALDTRSPKARAGIEPSAGEPISLRDTWLDRAKELGFDPGHLLDLLHQKRPIELEGHEAERIAEDLLGPSGLTEQQSAFERRDVVRAVAERLTEGSSLSNLELLADRVLSSDEVVALGTTGRGGEERSTTTDLLETERELLRIADEQRSSGAGVARDEHVDVSLSKRPELSDEQREMVRVLTTSGDGVQVVVGKAGSGKTFALEAARAAWEEAGLKVTGAALAARAAAELADGAGIEAVTLETLRRRLSDGSRLISAKDVLVIDEAGMIGTRHLADIVKVAAEARAKVVLVGDSRQLPEIEAGGAFGALARTLGAVELTSNRRQENEWERSALDELRSGDTRGALRAYESAGRLHLEVSAHAARTALVGDWVVAHSTIGSNVRMYASRRDDVDSLNALARAELRRRGRLGPDVLEVPGSSGFALGDEVVCLRNDPVIDVTNGTFGRVARLEQGDLVLETSNGERRLGHAYLEQGFLAHGYASTIHKAQGATVDRAFVLGTASLYREAGYVAMSRARGASDVYVVGGAFETGSPRDQGSGKLSEFEAAIAMSRAKALATSEMIDSNSKRLPDVSVGHGPIPQRSSATPIPPRQPDARSTDRRAGIPRYLSDSIGNPPQFADERAEWNKVARLIDSHRKTFEVTSDAALGERPKDPTARAAYDEVLASIMAYSRRLERTLELPVRNLSRGR